MSDFVQVQTDGPGKKVAAREIPREDGTVHQQKVEIADGSEGEVVHLLRAIATDLRQLLLAVHAELDAEIDEEKLLPIQGV